MSGDARPVLNLVMHVGLILVLAFIHVIAVTAYAVGLAVLLLFTERVMQWQKRVIDLYKQGTDER